MVKSHEAYMEIALKRARAAADEGEVPIGAVLIDSDGEVLYAAGNQVITRSDPTAHAEMLCLTEAARKTGNYRLLGTTLYVTIEPCVMCMGAVIHARVATVVFGAPDPKWGGAGSLYDLPSDRRLNHHPKIINGVCEDRCRALLQDFFRARRNPDIAPNGGFHGQGSS